MISDEHRFIFLHIPKTAGSSIRDALGGKTDARRVVLYGDRYKHLTAKQALEAFGQDKWESYFKFAFVRNPWERMVSFYSFHRQGGGCNARIIAFCRKRSFSDFLQTYVNIDRWQGPQFDWMTLDGNSLAVDFVGKVENLERDFSSICEKTGVDATLLRMNLSKHAHYTEFYDEQSRKIIANAHAKDIEYFGYKFDE